MDRRQFIKNSTVALGSLASVEGAGRALTHEPEQPAAGADEGPPKIGRPVRAVSIGFKPGLTLEEIAGLVDREGERGADIIALPETCRGQNSQSLEALDGPTVSTLARLAAKHRTYIVCPIDRKDGDRRLNSAVLLDRRGQVACIYDKMYPFFEEFAKHPGVHPGEAVTVFPGRLRPRWSRHLLRRELGAAVATPVGLWGGTGNLAERVLRRQISSVASDRL